MSWRFAQTLSEQCHGGESLNDALAAGTYSAISLQVRRPVRFMAPPALVPFLKMLAQPIAALAREISERGRRLRPGGNNYPARLDTASSQVLIVSPHTALSNLLCELEAGGGFIAVQQGGCFAVIASV